MSTFNARAISVKRRPNKAEIKMSELVDYTHPIIPLDALMLRKIVFKLRIDLATSGLCLD